MSRLASLFLNKTAEVPAAVANPATPAATGDGQAYTILFVDDEVNVLKAIKAEYPATIRIMLTGYADVDAVMGR